MMLAILIVSTSMYFLGAAWEVILSDFIKNPTPRMGLGAVMVMSWWQFCLPVAIIVLVFASLWTIVTLLSIISNR